MHALCRLLLMQMLLVIIVSDCMYLTLRKHTSSMNEQLNDLLS